MKLSLCNDACNMFLFLTMFFFSQPDRGAKRPRQDNGGATGGDEDPRGVKQMKGQGSRESSRYRDVVAGIGGEGGIENRDNNELEDKKKILDKLMDEDEEEPEVGHEFVFVIV